MSMIGSKDHVSAGQHSAFGILAYYLTDIGVDTVYQILRLGLQRIGNAVREQVDPGEINDQELRNAMLMDHLSSFVSGAAVERPCERFPQRRARERTFDYSACQVEQCATA